MDNGNNGYSPNYSDSGFQTVPSSIPPTPSPDGQQWSELSPHSNNSNGGGQATSSTTTSNGGPPPAHLHSHHNGVHGHGNNQYQHHHHSQQQQQLSHNNNGHHNGHGGHSLIHSHLSPFGHHNGSNRDNNCGRDNGNIRELSLHPSMTHHHHHLSPITSIAHHNLLTTNGLLLDGKPVIQAAVLAGKLTI